METKISSISQLEQATALSDNTLFVVSEPNEYANTGYKSKSLRFDLFRDYLSALVFQELATKISNISGNVYSYTSTLNYVTGTLVQNINTFIDNVTGDVNVAIQSINEVSGNIETTINNLISEISGNVSSLNTIEANINAVSADVTNNIHSSIDQITGDVYSEGGIQAVVEAVQANIANNITQQIEKVIGDVYVEGGIQNQVEAISANIKNTINQFIDSVNGSVNMEGGISNWISAQSLSVTNIINDLSAIRMALHYPICYPGVDEEGNNKTDIRLKDKHVNVVHITEGIDRNFSFLLIQEDGMPERFSRDMELMLYVEADNPTINWDSTVQYYSPDDPDILTTFESGTTYIYYFSEIDVDVMYVARQVLNVIKE